MKSEQYNKFGKFLNMESLDDFKIIHEEEINKKLEEEKKKRMPSKLAGN